MTKAAQVPWKTGKGIGCARSLGGKKGRNQKKYLLRNVIEISRVET